MDPIKRARSVNDFSNEIILAGPSGELAWTKRLKSEARNIGRIGHVGKRMKKILVLLSIFFLPGLFARTRGTRPC